MAGKLMRDYYLIVLSLVILLSGFSIAYLLNDAHYVNRFGALISGSAALFLIVQIQHDIRLEAQREDILRESGENFRSLPGSLPRELLQQRSNIRKKATLGRVVELRLRFVVVIALVTFVGEIVHGWGDLAFSFAVGAVH